MHSLIVANNTDNNVCKHVHVLMVVSGSVYLFKMSVHKDTAQKQFRGFRFGGFPLNLAHFYAHFGYFNRNGLI